MVIADLFAFSGRYTFIALTLGAYRAIRPAAFFQELTRRLIGGEFLYKLKVKMVNLHIVFSPFFRVLYALINYRCYSTKRH